MDRFCLRPMHAVWKPSKTKHFVLSNLHPDFNKRRETGRFGSRLFAVLTPASQICSFPGFTAQPSQLLLHLGVSAAAD